MIEGYKSSYVDMLDRFSEEAMDFDAEQINEYKESISNFFDLFQVTYKQSCYSERKSRKCMDCDR